MCFLERVFYQSGDAKKLGRVLLLLRQVHRLALQHVQQRLRTLQNLHVRSLGLLNRLVVLIPCLLLPCQALVELLQAVRENAQILRSPNSDDRTMPTDA